MTKNAIAAVVGSLCALLLCEPHSFGQSLSGTSLLVSGTGTINTLVSGTATIGLLEVTGTADFQDNTWLFGMSGTDPGISAVYNDGTSGANSSLTFTATRPQMLWKWQRVNTSGTSASATMQIDASNRLILTGTDATNPPQLILDPNNGGTCSLNGSSFLTQTAADGLYLTQNTADSLYLSGKVLTIDDSGNLRNLSQRPDSFLELGAYGDVRWHTDGGDGNVQTINNDGEFAAVGVRQGSNGFIQIGSVGSGHLNYLKIEDYFNGNPYSLGKLRAADCGAGDLGSEFAILNTDGSASFAGDGCGNFLATINTAGGALFSGNVGIGTPTPQAALDVQGNARFSGPIRVAPQGDPTCWVPTDDLFTIGNGTDLSHLSNALVVKKNGNTTVYGKLTVSATDGSTATTPSGYIIAYDDGTSGTNSAITLQSSRPSSVWNWQRTATSGSATPAMQLDASNRLILTGTAATNPPQIVLDPNLTSGSNGVLTQQAADSRYVVNGGIAGTILASTTISGTATINGGLTVSGTATTLGVNGNAAISGTLAVTSTATPGLAVGNGSTGSIKIGDGTLSKTAGSGWKMDNLQVSGANWQNGITFTRGGVNAGLWSAGTNILSFSTDISERMRIDPIGNVGIGTTAPQARLDVNGDTKISGKLTISGSGSLTLPDGTILSGSHTLSNVITSGTAAYALASTTAAALSGAVQATQVNGLAAVATTGAFSSIQGCPTTLAGYGITDPVLLSTGAYADPAWLTSLAYSKLTGAPTNVSAFTNDAGYITSSGTASNLAVSGTTNISGQNNISGSTKITGGVVVTGTLDSATNTVVATGTNQLVLIPQQGDLSMGDFINGAKPQ